MGVSSYVEEVCKSLSGLSGSSVSIYEKDEKRRVVNYLKHPKEFDVIAERYYVKDQDNETGVSYRVEGKLFFGTVKSKKYGESVLVGPMKLLQLTENEIRQLMFKFGLNQTAMPELIDYFDSLTSIQFQYAIQILAFLYLVLNEESISLSKFVMADAETIRRDKLYDELQSHAENVSVDDRARHASLDFERLMLFYVQNGKKDDLLKLFESTPVGRTGQMAADALRQEKNNAICSITLSTRAAIKGGLNSEIALQMSDLTIQKIEACYSIASINMLNYQFLLEICDRIAELQKSPDTSPMINRVIEYINGNAASKLTVEEIAARINTNRSFLSNKFKAETGVSLTDFILRQKIVEAKRLLLYSDKSLSEIAMYLSFSSQSHFQNAFKKSTGLTPAQFRKSATK